MKHSKTAFACVLKGHLNRGAFFLVVLIGVCLIPVALAQRTVSQRTLTFAERVAYQRAIEEVYWRHRIWPKSGPIQSHRSMR